MKTITFVTEIAQAGDTRYIPVPCRGNVHSVRVACDATMVNEKTIIFSRGATAVNTVTAATTTAGTMLDGVPDTDKALIFDPDSSTAANQVIKMVTLVALVAAGATLMVRIEYDDSAYVEQAATEA